VLLTGNTKTKIEFHLTRLRAEISDSKLPDPRKQALNEKLDELRKELENPRDGYGKTMAIRSAVLLGLGGIAAATTVAAEGPLAVTKIMKLIAQDKETEEAAAARLAPPPKALPAPEKKPVIRPKPAGPSWDAPVSNALDDEIPF
jgi:hypothetical protein